MALRTFATDGRETIPDVALRDRPVWAFVTVLIGDIVFTVHVAIGV